MELSHNQAAELYLARLYAQQKRNSSKDNMFLHNLLRVQQIAKEKSLHQTKIDHAKEHLQFAIRTNEERKSLQKSLQNKKRKNARSALDFESIKDITQAFENAQNRSIEFDSMSETRIPKFLNAESKTDKLKMRFTFRPNKKD